MDDLFLCNTLHGYKKRLEEDKIRDPQLYQFLFQIQSACTEIRSLCQKFSDRYDRMADRGLDFYDLGFPEHLEYVLDAHFENLDTFMEQVVGAIDYIYQFMGESATELKSFGMDEISNLLPLLTRLQATFRQLESVLTMRQIKRVTDPKLKKNLTGLLGVADVLSEYINIFGEYKSYLKKL